jgi:hypothetical protein
MSNERVSMSSLNLVAVINNLPLYNQHVRPGPVGEDWNLTSGSIPRVIESRTRSARACQWLSSLAMALFTSPTLTRTAHAADASEFWPEANGFITLNKQTRLFLDAAYADGKETDHPALDLAAYIDISLKPIVKKLQTEDWQRSRYFWARIGYDRVLKGTGDNSADVSENRGIISFYGKAMLPAEFEERADSSDEVVPGRTRSHPEFFRGVSRRRVVLPCRGRNLSSEDFAR